MAFIYTLMILFVLYCIVSDWFMHEYGEKLSFKNFNKFKIISFFSYQVKTLKPLKKLVRLVNLNEANLAKQPIFWIGIIVPLLVAGWVEYHIILLNPDLLSFEKLDDFFKASSSAIYISALTPTLGILISNIHKSIQVSVELKSSDNNNKVNLFFKHRDWFVDEINKINKKNKVIKIRNPLMLYKRLYPYSNYRDGFIPKISKSLISSLTHELMEADLRLGEFNVSVNYLYFEMSSFEFDSINKCSYDIENSINYLDFYLINKHLLNEMESFFSIVQNDSDFDPYTHGKDVIYEKYNLINDKIGSYLSFFSECILVIDGLVKIIEFDELNRDISNEVKKYLNSFKGNVTILNEYIIEYRKIDPIEYYGNDFKDKQ
ncbi:hypothetical protein [Providencia rettgeri]|uniref:hypothetical protein n=1 Tax=Providencia rettgeri TaxID=587 RepID=UPI000D7DE782|nr:hypothetical protein [Providencia rettgeri]AWS50639.1 hypothetical protein AM461_07385 [Providencia rettgeri]